jgi:hypothetical protein
MAGDQLLDPSGKPLRCSRPDLQSEAAQNAAQAHLDIEQLRLNELARCQQGTYLLRRQRFAVYRTKPAEPDQLRNAAGIIAVGLHRHRLERITYVPRLQQLDRKSNVPQRRVKPLRQRAGLQSDPLKPKPNRAEPRDQCSRLARNLRLPNNLASRINNAHARAFQRNVDSGIMIHGRPSMMLGADVSDSVELTPSV